MKHINNTIAVIKVSLHKHPYGKLLRYASELGNER
jgi:hypothetical protein